MRRLKLGRLLGAVFFLLVSVAPVWAQKQGWEKQWKGWVAGAKKEGRIVVTGDPDPVMSREIPAKFTSRYGVTVEWIGGRGSEIAARIRMERRARVYTIDVFTAGIGTAANILYAEKLIDPLKPVLIHPDVTDPSKWKKGKPWFVDPEEKYILRLLNYVVPIFYINTAKAKREEFKVMRDILNPKWKGKISAFDPTAGRGSNYAARMYTLFGEEFVKKLYIDQKPVLTRNRRQIHDWLARGIYPIALSASDSEIKRMQKDGFPVETVFSLSDLPGITSAGDGMMALMKGVPHPNAARVFVNWLASREGMEIFSKSRLYSTTRSDVDESFLAKESIPVPGAKYFDGYGWKFTTETRLKVRRRMRELLGR